MSKFILWLGLDTSILKNKILPKQWGTRVETLQSFVVGIVLGIPSR